MLSVLNPESEVGKIFPRLSEAWGHHLMKCYQHPALAVASRWGALAACTPLPWGRADAAGLAVHRLVLLPSSMCQREQWWETTHVPASLLDLLLGSPPCCVGIRAQTCSSHSSPASTRSQTPAVFGQSRASVSKALQVPYGPETSIPPCSHRNMKNSQAEWAHRVSLESCCPSKLSPPQPAA